MRSLAEEQLCSPVNCGNLDTVFEDELVDYNVQWSADVGIRVGFVNSANYHFYGRAGYAMQNIQFGYINYSDDLSSVESDERISEDFSGWSVGVGMEKAISNNTLGRLEIEYTQIETFERDAIPISSPGFETWSYDPSSVTLTAALVINF